ncbi:hypothetical protein BAE44_0019368 [Dichanthelium oligosanthes]|uniref:Bifunctional inhibitor/plant lipid transfer protein/seed storage helical domain-containing protein n=1 Tax=Dichanthelium oligosanthes TaxID=888268 RepID=A0A1E5V372_9POAL|nr:hypothetical protein BAE44_0019368 [Dichanthelium oligosanthes]
MFPGKAAALVLLCAIFFHNPVVGAPPDPCTIRQKKRILLECDPVHRTPFFKPDPDSTCCMAVRMVPRRNMLCIVSKLTREDKAKYSARKILGFKDACKLSSAPFLHHQVKSYNNC